MLGVDTVTLLDHPDGRLTDVPACVLDAAVTDHVQQADVVVVFAPNGVTGHPDHQAATAAHPGSLAACGSRLLSGA